MISLAEPNYAVFFALAAATVICLYVVLDGFDLGVGILFPFAPRSVDREIMMESLVPFWDGNETWLVLGGMVLLSGFPLAFSILLPMFYVPLFLMLFGLVLRGVAFEFRSQGGPFQVAWSAAFAFGSFIAAFCQGAVLGAFVDGSITVVAGRFAGGPFDWFGPFSIVTGLGVVAGYGLLGACWLIWKTEGATQLFARELALTTLLCSGSAIFVVSIWTPLALPQVADRWFAWPGVMSFLPLPLAAIACAIGVFRTRWSRHEWAPFVLSVGLFVTSLAAIGASIWPSAIPGVMTIWQASSTPRTQALVANALIVIVPIILAYILGGYWLFRGKVKTTADHY